MADFYNENDIICGPPSRSGHIVFKKAKVKSSSKKIVYKLNKHDLPILSLYEVALTSLISLFLRSNLTPRQKIVKNEAGKVVGLASEHFCYAIERRETLTPRFYSLARRKDHYIIDPQKREKAEDIPLYFLNEFPSGFFADLYKASLAGELNFDMASLASVLCSAYTLEEDDLHKGNFGFYIVEQGEKPKVVFFKIDNDLLLSDSLMSHHEARIVHWRHGENAFKITARDLREFPKLMDSKNHYWPTSLRYFVNHSDPKVYNNYSEIEAFIALGKSPEFQQAKWREWYKHILLHSAMIKVYLSNSLDITDPHERAQLSLINQATIARLSQLKAVLFSLPEFRNYVAKVNNEELSAEIFREVTELNDESYRIQLNEQLEHLKEMCTLENGFKKGDTPLHVAIRLGDYRYHETWGYFKEFANQANDAKEKPLDVAVKLAQEKLAEDPDKTIEDPRKNPLFIMKHLVSEGVNKTRSFNLFHTEHRDLKVISYSLQSPYLDKARDAKNADGLIAILRDLGEDIRFSLKMKKEISVYCLKFFLKNKEPNQELVRTLNKLQQALNGGNGREPRPELQFIRQLRSSLWIVRVIRGLLGGTSTQVELNSVIDNARKKLPSSSFASYFPCFFVRQEPNPSVNVSNTLVLH